MTLARQEWLEEVLKKTKTGFKAANSEFKEQTKNTFERISGTNFIAGAGPRSHEEVAELFHRVTPHAKHIVALGHYLERKTQQDPSDFDIDFVNYIAPQDTDKAIEEVTYVPQCDLGKKPAYQIKAEYSDQLGSFATSFSYYLDTKQYFHPGTKIVTSRVKIQQEEKASPVEIQITLLDSTPYSRLLQSDPDNKIKETLWKLYQTSLTEIIFVHCASGVGETGQWILCLELLSTENIFQASPDDAAKKILEIVEQIRQTCPGLVWNDKYLDRAISDAFDLHNYALEKGYAFGKRTLALQAPTPRSVVSESKEDTAIVFDTEFAALSQLFCDEEKRLTDEHAALQKQRNWAINNDKVQATLHYHSRYRERRIKHLQQYPAIFREFDTTEKTRLHTLVTEIIEGIKPLESLDLSKLKKYKKEVCDVLLQCNDPQKTIQQLKELKEKFFLDTTKEIAKNSFKTGSTNSAKIEKTATVDSALKKALIDSTVCEKGRPQLKDAVFRTYNANVTSGNFIAAAGPKRSLKSVAVLFDSLIEADVHHVVAIGDCMKTETCLSRHYDFYDYVAPQDQGGEVTYTDPEKSYQVKACYEPPGQGALKTLESGQRAAVDGLPVKSRVKVKRNNGMAETKATDDAFEINITFLTLRDDRPFDLTSSPDSLKDIFWEYHQLSSKESVLVHCAEGVGRTGSFIFTEMLFSEIFFEDVFSKYTPDEVAKKALAVLDEIRVTRPGLVWVESQFTTAIHNAAVLRKYVLQKNSLPENYEFPRKPAPRLKPTPPPLDWKALIYPEDRPVVATQPEITVQPQPTIPIPAVTLPHSAPAPTPVLESVVVPVTPQPHQEAPAPVVVTAPLSAPVVVAEEKEKKEHEIGMASPRSNTEEWFKKVIRQIESRFKSGSTINSERKEQKKSHLIQTDDVAASTGSEIPQYVDPLIPDYNAHFITTPDEDKTGPYIIAGASPQSEEDVAELFHSIAPHAKHFVGLSQNLKTNSYSSPSADCIDYIIPQTVTRVTHYTPDSDPGEKPPYQIEASYSSCNASCDSVIGTRRQLNADNIKSRVKIKVLGNPSEEKNEEKETEIHITFLDKNAYWLKTDDNSDPNIKKLHDDAKKLYWQLYQTSLQEYIFVHCASGVGETGWFVLMLMLLSSHEIFEKSAEDAANEILEIVARIRKNRPALIWTSQQLQVAIKHALLLYTYASEQNYSFEKPTTQLEKPAARRVANITRRPPPVADQDPSLPWGWHILRESPIDTLFREESARLSSMPVTSRQQYQDDHQEKATSVYYQKNRRRQIRRMHWGYSTYLKQPSEKKKALNQSVKEAIKVIDQLQGVEPSTIETYKRELYEVVAQGDDFKKTKDQLDALKEKHAIEVVINVAKKSFVPGTQYDTPSLDSRFLNYPVCQLTDTKFFSAPGPQEAKHVAWLLGDATQVGVHHIVAIGNDLHDKTCTDKNKRRDFLDDYVAPENQRENSTTYLHLQGYSMTVAYRPIEGALETTDYGRRALDGAPIKSEITVNDHTINLTFLPLADGGAFDLRSSSHRVREIFWEHHEIPSEQSVLVHCKAGYGRTGNFIFTQVLFSEIFSQETIFSLNKPNVLARKILAILSRLRQTQPNLLLAENQFIMAIRNAFFLREYALQKRALQQKQLAEKIVTAEPEAKIAPVASAPDEKKEESLVEIAKPLFAMSPPKNYNDILRHLTEKIKKESENIKYFDPIECRNKITESLKQKNPGWEWKTPLIDNAEHSIQQATLLAFVEQLSPLTLEKRNEQFIIFQNEFRKDLVHKNKCWDAFFGIKNTGSWIAAMDQMRKDALQKLKDGVQNTPLADKLRRLEDARRLSIFNEHRDNVTLRRTTNAVDEIDRLIKEARQEIAASSVTRSPFPNNR